MATKSKKELTYGSIVLRGSSDHSCGCHAKRGRELKILCARACVCACVEKLTMQPLRRALEEEMQTACFGTGGHVYIHLYQPVHFMHGAHGDKAKQNSNETTMVPRQSLRRNPSAQSRVRAQRSTIWMREGTHASRCPGFCGGGKPNQRNI